MNSAGGGCLTAAGVVLAMCGLILVAWTVSDMAAGKDWLHVGGTVIGIGLFVVLLGGALVLAGRSMTTDRGPADEADQASQRRGPTL